MQACDGSWNKPGTANTDDQRGHSWGHGTEAQTIFNPIVTPNSTLQPWSSCGTLQFGGASFRVATSNHPGGVKVLFADGGVKFVKNSINQRTWWPLGTRANGEVIGADSDRG